MLVPASLPRAARERKETAPTHAHDKKRDSLFTHAGCGFGSIARMSKSFMLELSFPAVLAAFVAPLAAPGAANERARWCPDIIMACRDLLPSRRMEEDAATDDIFCRFVAVWRCFPETVRV